jgi:hypothetical protein
MFMKKLAILLFIAFSLTAATAQTKLSQFAGMAGCWERRDDAKKLLITEQWMSPEGTSIIGMARTVKDGRTVDWEFMRIEERADGFYFVAKPKANTAETDFKLIESVASKFIFENKAHDFPQRVIYTLAEGKLIGRIEGTIQGKFKGTDFPMTRAKCG